MRGRRTEAIVVRRTNYGEADRIVQLITPEGKLSVLARGVRRPKSKLAGGIELLSVSDITYLAGKGELATLTSARANTFFGHIVEDYDRLQLAYTIIKDITQISQHLNESGFFSITKTALQSLDDTTIPPPVSELYYWLHSAALLGEAVNLARDNNGDKLDATRRYRFDTMARAFVADDNGQYDSNHIKLLRLASLQLPAVVAQIRGLKNLIDDCLVVARSARP